MANRYIRQDLERRMILMGLTDEEIAVFIHVAIAKELSVQESKIADSINGTIKRKLLSRLDENETVGFHLK